MDRVDALEQLASRRFDLLVIGGGIIGAGIAEAASAHGLSVALVDKGDFGSATSSASSKLIHGGLRYLRLGDVGLVREAHHERRLLMTVVAPHLVRRLPFLFPLYDDGPFRPWFVQTGIVLYSTIARARLNGPIAVERARRMVPQLRADGLRKCALYADAWTNDGRLTLANVRGAADAGAVVLNYAEVVALRGREGAEVHVDGRTIAVRADRVVNASGPWVDRVRRLEDPDARASMRLSKGVHVLVEGGDRLGRRADDLPRQGARDLRRPLGGHAAARHDGHAARRRAGDGRRDRRGRRTGPVGGVARGRGHRRGARVVLGPARPPRRRGDDGERAARDRLLDRPVGDGQRRRRQAHDVPADRARRAPPSRRARAVRAAAAASGRDGARADRVARRARPATRNHLLHLYGSLAVDVLAPAADDPSLLEPLVPGRPDLRAQEAYARAHEWALTDEDVIRRRTTAWLAPVT